MLAYNAGSKKMCAASVTAINGDGTYAVKFKNGEAVPNVAGTDLKQVGPEVLERGILDEGKLDAMVNQLNVWREQINAQKSYATLADLLKLVEGGAIDDIEKELPKRCKVFPVSRPNGGTWWVCDEGNDQVKADEARGAIPAKEA